MKVSLRMKGRMLHWGGCLALAILILSTMGMSDAQGQQTVAVVGGTLIDGNGGLPLRNSSIIIEDYRIVEVGPMKQVKVPDGARVLRADGKTIMPGLINTHMHIGGSGASSVDPREFTPTASANNFKAYLKFGITSVFDMAAHPFLEEQQAALADGTMTGPRLFGVKYGITSPGAHPLGLLKEYGLTEFLGPLYFIVTSEEEGREAVRKIATDKTDGVKIFHSRTEFPGTQRVDADKEKMKPEVLRAIIDESHRHSLKVFAHISFPSEAKEVVEAGGDGLVHSITMAETGTPAIFKMMADHSVYYNPTLASLEAYYGLNVDPFMTQRLRGKVWDVLLDSIENPKGVVRTRHELPGLANDAQRSLEISMANLGRAVKAGVKIVMGDDAGNAGTLHGATIPREMELMNEAGMTPMQVIVAATKTASEWIGQADKLGTLEVGKLADLIVINGDPLRDMSDIRKVELVIKNGQVIDPAAIMFDDVPAKQ